MKKRIIVLVAAMFILSTLVACKGLSGTYTSEDQKYSVEFINAEECVWYQDNESYTGYYEKTDDGYVMETEGNGFLYFTKYTIVEDGRDLIITGGVLDKERFVK